MGNLKKTTLSNGIRVVTEKMDNIRSVSLGVWVMSGSRNETTENNGVSHFVEHMVFKGTEKRTSNEIAQSIESVGGVINAFTSRETTCFYAKIMDENQFLALDVLTDLITQPKLDLKELRKERKVIIEELKNCEDTPDDIIHDRFVGNIFANSPIGFTILGPKKNISSFTQETVRNYLNENYTPERILVAASGNVDHEKIASESEKWLEKFRGKAKEPNKDLGNFKTGTFTKTDEIQQAHVLLGGRAYEYGNRKKIIFMVLNTILGGGMSSRLFQTIREKHGLAYTIYSFADNFIDSGMYGVYVGTDKNKIQQCIDLIWKELTWFTKNLVSEQELNKVKSQLKGSLMLSLESTSSRMMRLAKMELYLGKSQNLDEVINAINDVTSQDIQEIASEIFREENLSVSIIKPKK
ncbi:insulinase family protein [bacterium]|nr:insulinase family protein [bacterium]